MKKGLRLKIYIGCLLLILFGVLCGFADQTEQRVIKVGYVPTEGYIEKTENGTYKGYMSEYLELLSYYGEWQCEYVPGTVEECRTWLAEGKIDILPGISRVETVEGIVLSDLPLDQVNDSIYVLDDGKIASYENLQDMRIGYVEGCPLNEDYFQKKRLNCEFEAFSHMSELLTALEEQKVNGAMGVFCSDASDLKLIAKLNPRAVYIGFHQGDEEVKAQVEDALEKVSMEMPELLEELKEKYSASSKNYEVVLSSVEQEWLKDNPVLRIAYVRDDIPNEYRNEEGNAAGINVEVIQKALKKIGLVSYWIPVENVQEGIDYLENGLVDAVAGVNGDIEGSTADNLKNLLLTEAYRETSYSVLGEKGVSLKEGETPVFVLQKGDVNGIQYVYTHFPKSQIIQVNSEADVFEKIKRGKGEATVVPDGMEEYYTLKYGSSIAILAKNHMQVSLSMAIGHGGSKQVMLSVLNHAIRHLTMEEVNGVVLQNSTLQKDYTLWMNIKKNIVLILAVTGTVVGIFVLYMFLQRRHQNAKFWKAVYIDNVTQRDNYEKMLLDIDSIFKEGHQKEYAVCYMDIVKFKHINESFGYAEGDRLLKTISDGIELNRKEGEYFSRVSADQFVFFVKDRNKSDIIKRMEQLESYVIEENHKNEMNYSFKLLIGIYLLNEEEDKMLALDKANIARKSIKNREINIAVYDEQMNARIAKEREIEAIMEKSLKNQEFLVYLQPRVDIKNGRIVGAEALVRWQRTNNEFLYPGVFVPLFEKNGFIRDLDFYMYEKVCGMIRTRLDENKPIVPISLNVSRLNLVGEDFIKRFNSIVHKAQIPEGYLELELTESLLVEDATVMIDTVNQLKANHYSVSIDDFGSGYSSLNVLKQLNFDVLKIDREFLREDGFQQKDIIILESVIRMAKDLEMKTLIKGVETLEQVEMLRDLGCDYAQGYYFAKPMPMQEFVELLDKQEAENK